MKFYLTGAITHDEDANGWRQSVIDSVPKHEFINPMVENIDVEWQKDLNGLRAHADVCKAAFNQYEIALDRIRRIMRLRFMPRDFQWLDDCGGIICYVKRGTRIYGSACEMQRARDQDKVVILVSELSFAEMNDWEIGLTDMVFTKLSDMVVWLNIWDDEDITNECERHRSFIASGLWEEGGKNNDRVS